MVKLAVSKTAHPRSSRGRSANFGSVAKKLTPVSAKHLRSGANPLRLSSFGPIS